MSTVTVFTAWVASMTFRKSSSARSSISVGAAAKNSALCVRKMPAMFMMSFPHHLRRIPRPKFLPHIHQYLAKAIFSLAIVNAPDLIAPGVAFLQSRVAGGEEFGGEVGVTREFVADDLLHDGELHALPII